ncbi:MAG TPA: hypothetical protein VK911_17420, partial [Vicinamibacterales bacterium]|nr:hypothetical protein [Vicinamibacterales bacterium]
MMHVGERPYVVAAAGPVELSSRPLTLDAVAGMLSQLLPAEGCAALDELGAVEHELPRGLAGTSGRFTVVAARGGDDIWIEIRRHRQIAAARPALVSPELAPEPLVEPQPPPVAPPAVVVTPAAPVAVPPAAPVPAPTVVAVAAAPACVAAAPAAVAEPAVGAAAAVAVAPAVAPAVAAAPAAVAAAAPVAVAA